MQRYYVHPECYVIGSDADPFAEDWRELETFEDQCERDSTRGATFEAVRDGRALSSLEG